MFSAIMLKAQQQRPPNIIFILADDLGYGDIGSYGQLKIPTPNIDALALEGVTMTDFYAGAPVCSPSRCVLLTGKNSGHATIRGNTTIQGGLAGDKNGKKTYRANLLPDDRTIGNVLQQAGYNTALMGKWHLDGYNKNATPLQFGFDEFSGWLICYPETYTSTYWPSHWYRNGKVTDVPQNMDNQKGYYVSNLITDDAIAYMDARKGNETPFFLMVNHSNPHSPLDAPVNSLYDSTDWSSDQKTYASMISYLDLSVGRLKQYLEDHHLEENTIIIFSSDNGPRSEPSQQLTHIAEFFNSSGPLRGYKRDVTEGGIRIPMIVWNPKIFKAGTQLNVPGYFADIMPTLAGIASARPESYHSDGIDLYPVLSGKQAAGEDRFLYWEFFEGGFVQAVRYGQWKAIVKDNHMALYDLSNDIREQNDVSKIHSDVVVKIAEYLKTCRTESPYWPVTKTDKR